jgi:flavin reductase (DIM6/NTAB) family NADH-FMN oxidoreductase RutF
VKKESIELNILWHMDALMHLYPITIVTTMDEQKKINAAPYSLVLPFCSSADNPQVLLIVCKAWHTAANIEATREFVINYPRTDQFKDILEVARFYPQGVNELSYTGFTTIASKFVCPPRIVECYQHLECRVHSIIRPSEFQINIIGDVVDLSMDEGLYGLRRSERARKTNIPLYFGMDDQQCHVFGAVDRIEPLFVNSAVD